MNTNFLIEDNDIKAAQFNCKDFCDINIRNKSAASGVGAIIAKKYFENTDFDIDTETGLYNVEKIIKNYQISDIYVNGNYIDVRIYFDNNKICVPKLHFDNDMLPKAYMFIKISPELTNAVVTGFILPDTITRIDDIDGYYLVNENALSPFEEIDYLFRDADDLFNVEDSEIFSFIENSMEEELKFVKKLILSKDGRIRFRKAYIAEKVLKTVELSNDQAIESADFETNEESFSGLLSDNQNEEYSFTTVVSPDFKEEFYDEENNNAGLNVLEELENEADTKTSYEEESIEEEPEQTKISDTEQDTKDNEIDTLFVEEEQSEDKQDFVPKKKQKSGFLPMLLLLAVIGGAGYFGYTKFMQPQAEIPNNIPQPTSENLQTAKRDENISDAMPIESVEKATESNSQDEGTSVSIPAIEQNLDASILVSNLRIDWEVPAGYASNTQVKRYLIKLGKIIQLNLKTELLLLNKPPISNRIAIELKYNQNNGSFETAEIVTSSGEKTVDDLIMQTVQKALEMKLNMNSNNLGKLSGNPVLIIKL